MITEPHRYPDDADYEGISEVIHDRRRPETARRAREVLRARYGAGVYLGDELSPSWRERCAEALRDWMRGLKEKSRG